MHLLPNLIHIYIEIHWVQDSFTYTSFITKVRFFAANPCYLHYISVYIYKSHQYPPGNKMSPSRAILSRWFSSSLLVGYVSSHQEGNTSLNIFLNSQRVPSYERRAPSCLGSIQGKSYPTVILVIISYTIITMIPSLNNQDFSWTPGPRDPGFPWRNCLPGRPSPRCGWPSGSCRGYITRTSEWEPKVVKAGIRGQGRMDGAQG